MAKKRSVKSSKTKSPDPNCPTLPAPSTADDAVDELKAGNKRYLTETEQLRCNALRRQEFHIGQQPWAIVLTCADSRLPPELIFDTGLGELFVVRVAGNIANACSIASIEYAVANLPAKLILVLGHENCGAVAAALQRPAISYNLNHLLGHLAPTASEFADKWASAPKKNKPEIELDAVRSNTRTVASQLREQSEIIGGAKQLPIIPAVYETGSGKVKWDTKRSWR